MEAAMALSMNDLIYALYGSGLILLGFMVGYATGSYRSLHRHRRNHLR
jgi:hypothetical protein